MRSLNHWVDRGVTGSVLSGAAYGLERSLGRQDIQYADAGGPRTGLLRRALRIGTPMPFPLQTTDGRTIHVALQSVADVRMHDNYLTRTVTTLE